MEPDSLAVMVQGHTGGKGLIVVDQVFTQGVYGIVPFTGFEFNIEQ